MRIVVLILLIGSATVSSLCAQPQTNRRSKQPQGSFGEDGVRHPVKLPAAARRAINATTTMKDFNPGSPCAFTASPIDLNGDSITDYVVTNCMGTDNVHYWIVWHDRTSYRVVFDDGLSSLDILNTRTNGFYDLRTKWDVAVQGTTELWKFRTGSYRIARQWSRHRKQD